MDFQFGAHTDVGIKKETNQDSLCIMQGQTDNGNLLMAIMCDGMGGLDKGEVASASVIKAFSDWFNEKLPSLLGLKKSMDEVRYCWDRMIKKLNLDIADYGRQLKIQLGSTLTGILIFENGDYLIGHIGDSRAYCIDDINIKMLTGDQTVIANEINHGRLTVEQAENDPRKNVLLQCIGASKIVEPEFIYGKAKANECYMLCSDGFRHVISSEEIKIAFAPANNSSEEMINENLVKLVELNKSRGECDNISAVLIRIS